MRRELIVFREPKSPISEIYRTLRTNIQFMNAGKSAKTILITSPLPKEGKSWVSVNLATTFAQMGKKVLLIDADMRKGRQYSILHLLPKPGLSNYLSGVTESIEGAADNISTYIQQSKIENLDVIVSGNVPPNPAELLNSEKMIKVLRELRAMYDVVIIDGTPCQLVADSLILARMVDSTILVAAYKTTKKKELQKVITAIRNVGGIISGVVLNKMPRSAKEYEQSYYYNFMPATTKQSKPNYEIPDMSRK